MRLAHLLIMVFISGLFTQSVWAEDNEVFTVNLNPLIVKLFIPRDTKVVRGIVLHATNYKMNPQDRWAEMCRTMDWAHMAVDLNGKKSSRPQAIQNAIDEGLKQLAEQTGHKELVNVPLTAVGHSAGGMGMGPVLKHIDRALTNCISCGWVADPSKMSEQEASIPYLCTLGAIPDGFKMLPGIETSFLPARKAGRPWGLAVQWGCAHDFGNSACLFVPWIRAVNAFRVPKDWDPSTGPAKLTAMTDADGWLGDRATVESNFATVAAFADYKGDKATAAWFPSRDVAYVWRAMMSKDAPLVLQAAATDDSAKLGEPNPKSERGMLVNPGLDVVLKVSHVRDLDIRQVEYFNGDVSLGTAKADPWEMTWKSPAQGAHPIYALWTDASGKIGTTNPALIVIRRYPVTSSAKEVDRPEDNKGPK